MIFEQRVLQFIKKNNLVVPRGLVITGVSGGADSMALLLTLAHLRHSLGVQLHAIHFNHQFRVDSLHDVQFVAHWCKQLNVPLTIGRRLGGKIKHLSEDEARQMRFEFFRKTAKQLNAQSVALAHTKNDLAETVLMRLMRGSGLYGLRAILPSRVIDSVTYVRPLMGINRQDVEAYLQMKKTPFCTDSTNSLMSYERNKVRLELLPALARGYNPQIINALSDLATTAGEDYDFLSQQASKQFKKNVITVNKKVKLDLQGIKNQHPAIIRLLLRLMVESLTQDPSLLTFDHIQALENIITSNSSECLHLSNHLKAVKKQKHLEIFYA